MIKKKKSSLKQKPPRSPKRARTVSKSTKGIVHRRAQLIDLSFEPIFSWGLDQGIVEWNCGCEQLYGYSRHEALGQVSHQLLQTQFPISLAEAEKELVAKGIWKGELRHRTREGHEVIVDSRWQLLIVDGRRIVLEADRDIAARKRVDELVREMNLALSQAMPGISRIRSDGRYQEVNRSYAAMLGYEPAELVGQSWEPTVHPEDVPLAQAAYEQMLKEGKGEFECRAVRKDGSIFFKQVMLVKSEGTPAESFGHHCFMRDVTERKQMDVELAEREERLRLFVEHSPVALAMFDPEMRYIAVSRRWQLDYDEGPLIGRSHYEICPDIPERWKAVHRRCLAGAVERCEEDPFLRADGRTEWTRWEIRPWLRADGSVGGIVIFAEDITERKQAEEALHQKQRELQQSQAKLQDLAAKLFMAQDSERQRIARDLHDDFTQRLAALALDVGSLERSSGSTPALISRCQHIRKVTEQLTKDIHNLSYRLHPSSMEHLGLDAAIRDHVGEIAQRTQLDVQYVVRDVPNSIPTDQIICLYRVVQESLQNVLKHAEASTVVVRLLGTTNGVEVSVHDNGKGFLQEDGPSRGLGLFSMEERVRLLQGTFRIRAHPGKGTQVYAWVPLQESPLDAVS